MTIYHQTLNAHEAALEARLRNELDSERERMHAQVQKELDDRMRMMQSMAEKATTTQRDRHEKHLKEINEEHMGEVANLVTDVQDKTEAMMGLKSELAKVQSELAK